MHDDDVRCRGRLSDGCEIARKLVGRWFDQRRVDGERWSAHEQRVAVSGRFGHGLHADRAAAARAVIRDDLHAERLAHALRDGSRDGVDAAAWRGGDDEADRLGGVFLRIAVVHRREAEGERECGDGRDA
jgi:hypothetical protein